jgi:CBS domain containing-hemolysin-like protein
MTESSSIAVASASGGEATTPSDGEGQSRPRRVSDDDVPRPSLLQKIGELLGLKRSQSGSDIVRSIANDVQGEVTPAEQAMFQNILHLRQVRVEDVMVPRAEIEAVEMSTTLGELITVFERCAHSRMPVYVESLDDPRGMVHIQDVLAHISRAARPASNGQADASEEPVLELERIDLNKTIGELELMRPLLFVPPSMLAADLMARMQASRIQMALVIDEYGGTDGLVSLEDIVEMVVGDIEDEHDEDEPMIEQISDGVFVVDAKAEIDEVETVIGGDFRGGEHSEEVDTIGGMIFNTLGRVPTRGEVVAAVPGYEFHILDADPRRVKRVRIVQGRSADRRRRLPKPVNQPAGLSSSDNV